MRVKPLILSSFLVLGVVACVALGTKVPVSDVTPAAKSITIYSVGGSVVSGTVDSRGLEILRLRLPPTAQGITLFQNNESLKWFTTQLISENSGNDKALLVGLPSMKAGELTFNYALPEITWVPRLTASIIDPKSVNLQLQAAITMGANQIYKNCDVSLVLNNAVSLEKITGYTFKLNSFDLYPNRNVVYNLDNKIMDYSLLREWHTYGTRDEVHVLVQTKNPFSINLDQTNFAVESHQVSIEAGSINNQVRPGETLSLSAGIDDTIFTFSNVKIAEATVKKALPFNHKISYQITNKSDQEKTLRLVSDRVSGVDHRSLYHFMREPDATPEKTLVWLLTLKPRSTELLEYDYDADVKEVPGETGFEAGM